MSEEEPELEWGVLVPVPRHKELLRAESVLQCFEESGIKEWEFYDYAMEMYDRKQEWV